MSELASEPVSQRPCAPLDGRLVVELGQAISAPLCTRHLADIGARVVKVENPDGGDSARHYDGAVRGLAAHVVWLIHGKESAALRLTDLSDLDVFTRLLVSHARSSLPISTAQVPADQAGDRPEYARYEGRPPTWPAETCIRRYRQRTSGGGH